MECKLSSVMLALSFTLHQSLWGILASVPHTNAKQCKHKLNSEGTPVKRVQMIRRIPARCSGWDEAWSWLSQKDCKTKYILDYVELPSEIPAEDCNEDETSPSPSTQFNMSDERFLAIIFGSATLALIILIIIIVVSVFRKGNNSCSVCGARPSYSPANVRDQETIEGHMWPIDALDDTIIMKKTDPIYEEIFDPSKANKISEFQDEVLGENNEIHHDTIEEKRKVKNGVPNPRPITPSAPSEDDTFSHLTRITAVPNQYGILADRQVKTDVEVPVKTAHEFNGDFNDLKPNNNLNDTVCGSDLSQLKEEGKVNDVKVNHDISNDTCIPSSEFVNDSKGVLEDHCYSRFEDLIPLHKIVSSATDKNSCSDETSQSVDKSRDQIDKTRDINAPKEQTDDIPDIKRESHAVVPLTIEDNDVPKGSEMEDIGTNESDMSESRIEVESDKLQANTNDLTGVEVVNTDSDDPVNKPDAVTIDFTNTVLDTQDITFPIVDKSINKALKSNKVEDNANNVEDQSEKENGVTLDEVNGTCHINKDSVYEELNNAQT